MKKQKVITVSEALNLIKSGNRADGVELLYKHHYNKMYGVAFSIVKDEYKSKEVVSRVCYKLMTIECEKLPTTGEMAWLYAVIKNQAINLLKSEKADLSLEEQVKVGVDDVNINDFVNMEAYYSMIKGLNEEQRLIVTLKVIGGFTHKEIAQMLQKPVATVQWLYNISVKKLRVTLSSLALSFVAFVTLFTDKLVKKIQADKEITNWEDEKAGDLGNTSEVVNKAVEQLKAIFNREETKIIIFGVLALAILTLLILIFINSHKIKVCTPQSKEKKLSNKKSFAIGAATSLVAIIVAGVILAECGLISVKVFEKPTTADLTITVLDKNNQTMQQKETSVISVDLKNKTKRYTTDEKGQFVIQNCTKDTVFVIVKLDGGVYKMLKYTITNSDLIRGYAVIILGEEA